MEVRMDWNKLLSCKRVSSFDSCGQPSTESNYIDPRSPYEKDWDQLIFSYPFRRLQDKTQVIPFPDFDFVHTRLTHSLEVASVGRSLGKLVSDKIFSEVLPERAKELGITPYDIGTLVGAACLAHDIGNPPFGHSGESAISYYFKDNQNVLETICPDLKGYIFQEVRQLMQDQPEIAGDRWPNIKLVKDLESFEGNANGFRIITRNCDKGINYDDIAYCRHPLAFLMEAADDIAYGIIDFEDGCRLGLIDFEKFYSTVRMVDNKGDWINAEINSSPQNILVEIAKLDHSFDGKKVDSVENFREAISYLRSKIINVLIHKCVEVFIKNYEHIMKGNFTDSLLSKVSDAVVITGLNKMQILIRKFVYNYKPVLLSESSGFDVMWNLIDSLAISSNICLSCGDEEDERSRKLRSLLPAEYSPRKEIEVLTLSQNEIYTRIRSVLDYVSGMTDNYALSNYRRMKGITLP